LNKIILSPAHDPYDLWATPLGIATKEKFYANRLSGRIAAMVCGGFDWLFPGLVRFIFNCEKKIYPIVIAHEIITRSHNSKISAEDATLFLDLLKSVATEPEGKNGWAWGLGFTWMSKNGLYQPSVPFVTHTPYVMEALLTLAHIKNIRKEALSLFHSTWTFLENLLTMYDGSDGLAVSYAPMKEPRIVINANAYAAFAYGLHAIHGNSSQTRELAQEKSCRIVQWVTVQQHENGSWNYYADKQPGNFIDCFHTCFVLKNLLKTSKLLPELTLQTAPVILKGWNYLQDHCYVKTAGLCSRFTERDITDPFKWDLYDQAEYLNLLLDFELYDQANHFANHVTQHFHKKGKWYCKIDKLGRCWGNDFSRWGIAPFHYALARLKNHYDNSLDN
jgi:hypothetical protein